MWTVLTYVYNSILIIFIATHLIVGAILSFLAGLYIGVYLCQNYEIPKINEPSKLWGKFVVFMERYRKNPPSSKIDFLRPETILSIVKAEDYEHDDYQHQQNQQQRFASIASEEAHTLAPTLILTDPDFSDFDSYERYSQPSSLSTSPPSQILEASLVISPDDLSSLKYSKKHSKYD